MGKIEEIANSDEYGASIEERRTDKTADRRKCDIGYFGRWRRHYYGCFIAGETLLGFAVVILITIAFLYWKVSQSPIHLTYFASSIEKSMNERLQGQTVAIGDVLLAQKENGWFAIQLKDISLFDGDETPLAEAPSAEIKLSLSNLLLGELLPKSINLESPTILVDEDLFARGSEGDALLTVTDDVKTIGDLLELGTTKKSDGGQKIAQTIARLYGIAALDPPENSLFSELDEIGVNNTTLLFSSNETEGQFWSLKDGRLQVSRSGSDISYRLSANAPGDGINKPIEISGLVSERDGHIYITADTNRLIPASLSNKSENTDFLNGLNFPLESSMISIIDKQGSLVSVSGNIDLFPGSITVKKNQTDKIIPVNAGYFEWVYDPNEKSVSITNALFESEHNRINFSGSIRQDDLSIAESGRWIVDLVSDDIKIKAPAQESSEPLNISSLWLGAAVDPHKGVVEINRANLKIGDANFEIEGNISRGQESPIANIDILASSMNVDLLKKLWPNGVISKSREWVFENLISGDIPNVELRIQLADGDLTRIAQGGKITEDTISMYFDFADVKATYLKNFPPIERAKGEGRILAGQFALRTTNSSSVVNVPGDKQVQVKSLTLNVPSIIVKPAIGTLVARTSSNVSSALKLINYPPFKLAQKMKLEPTSVSGKSDVELEVVLPFKKGIKLDEIQLSAQSELTNLSSQTLLPGKQLSNGHLLLNTNTKSFELAGEIDIDDVPSRLNWSRTFRNSGNDKLNVFMRLTEKDRKKLGLTIPYLNGPLDAKFSPISTFGAKDSKLKVSADLTESQISYPNLSYVKPKGQKAQVEFVYSDNPSDKSKRISDLQFSSSSSEVSGNLSLKNDNSILSADLTKFNLFPGDQSSVKLSQTGSNGYKLTLNSRQLFIDNYLSLDSFASSENSNAASDIKGSLIGQINIQNLIGKNGNIISGLNGTFEKRADGQIEKMQLQGQLGSGPVKARVFRNQDKGGRLLVVSSDDAGEFFKYFNLYKRISGGSLELSLQMPENKNASAEGLFNVYEFNIVDEKVLNSLAAATPSNNGNAPGQSVYFKRMRIPFVRAPGIIHLGNSHIRGPVLGATFKGDFDLRNSSVNLSGTYVPLYALNNFLSRVPVFGTILTGGDNEGLLGMTFAVRGAVKNPSLTISPISAITPGLFRRIFDFDATSDVTGTVKSNRRRESLKNIPSDAAPIHGLEENGR